jgi:CHAT domain-containing protein
MRAWSRIFVDPLLPYLGGVDQLVVENNNFPLEPLVTPDGRFLVDRFEVTYTPSILGSWILDQRPRSRSNHGSALSVAGPSQNTRLETIDALARSTDETVDLRTLRSHFPREGTPLDRIPKLRYAGLEAAAIAALFPHAAVLRDDPGLEHRVWDATANGRIRDYDVVHIAAHTLTDVSSEKCGLMLSDRPSHADLDDDGVLELEEILLGWDLSASLVTLSGCETARAAGADRGEVLGFAQVMLSAGARNVLSSFWPVDDRATTLLMNRFYENLTGRYADTRLGRAGEPMPQARALREAKLYLRGIVDARGDHPFEHPVYWAGFILMGVPGRD